mmetsp:Transcript_22865/g.73595  ORF Transcript_22865/g.73595 Transcript_22865/m.73595 type:complete len:467 (+) Transcript_22865:3-1403(+)
MDGAPLRKTTAVAVVGEMGASFTLYEKNWVCTACKAENYARRPRCFRCKAAKPTGGGGYVMDKALENFMEGKITAWREALDPDSRQIYYYNTETGETTWDRPAEMGPAPYSTGWFGRGSATSDATNRYVKQNERYLKRPARKQAEFDPSKFRVEGQESYNIWYHKYMGDIGRNDKGPAEFRCSIEKDAGYTQADSSRERTYFCMWFAKGSCPFGHKCRYYHRLPTPVDDAALDMLHDCFGRERHAAHRDDMGGVGSFNDNSRTLYVGGLQRTPGMDLKEVIERHFGEWGEVENVNVIYRLAIAFVRFRLRTSAEFAKCAMHGQSLDGKEVLNVRWALDDPNPVAREAIKRANQDAVVAAMRAKGISTQQAGFEYPAEYQMPTLKRPRGAQEADAALLAYPDTAGQYAAAAEGSASGGAAAGAGAAAAPAPPVASSSGSIPIGPATAPTAAESQGAPAKRRRREEEE